jgi:hypothetical protein
VLSCRLTETTESDVKRLFLAALLLPACNWVSQADITDRWMTLDDDQDGFTRDGGGDSEKIDCNDSNKDIFPGAADAWYDGVDADCAGNDDYDQDADGFRSDSDPDTEGNIGDDCDDETPTIYPGAADTWYDGVDADCAGNDDYDQDADGYRSDSDPDTEGNIGDDCDDETPTSYPGAVDTWYDDVDADCAENDDYDQDADGHRSDSEPDPEGIIGDDCDDETPTSYPGAVDTWYDNVDADCAENDDYDQDADGHRSDSEPDPEGIIGDDCDDTLVDVHPGALEDLSEFSIDFDCDGAGDSVLMGWEASLSWEGIGSIHLGETSNRIYLSSVSNSFTDTTGATLYDLGVAVYWDPADLQAGPAGVEYWTSTHTEASVDRAIATGHSMLFESGYLYGAMALINSASNSQVRNERLYRLDLNIQSLATAAASSPGTADLPDITLFRDTTGSLRFIGCNATGTGSFHYLLTDDDYLDDPNTSAVYQDILTTLGRPRHCVAQDRGDTQPYLFYQNNTTSDALEQSSLDTSSFDSASLSINVQNQDASVEVNDLDYQVADGTDWLVLTDGLNSQIQFYTPLSTLFSQSTATTPDAIDMAWDSANSRMVLAWTDLAGGAHIGWADATGFLGSATLNSSLLATDIAVLAPENSGQIIVVLTDGDDVEMALIAAP